MYNTILTISIIVYALMLTGLLTVAGNSALKEKHYVKVKMLTSGGFIVAAYIFGYLGQNQDELLHLLPALAGCFIGDYFMGLYNRSRKKRFMGLGIGFFMLAHIGFLWYLYWLDNSIVIWDYLLPVVVILLTYLLVYVAHLHLGKIRPAVGIYSAFVTAFMVKAVHFMLVNKGSMGFTSYGVMTGVAGILFFTSDFSLLFLYFYHFHNKKCEKATHIYNLFSYYVAVFLIGLTLAVM